MPAHAITIYYNPACGTARKVLAALREAGHEPVVIEYLKNPPTRERLKQLIAQMGSPVRDAVRQKESLYTELGLDSAATTDEQLLDAMLAHPILINRPIVETPVGTKLCRPSETVQPLIDAMR